MEVLPHAVDDQGRVVFEREFAVETAKEYRKVIADDAELVSRIGAHSVAEVARTATGEVASSKLR